MNIAEQPIAFHERRGTQGQEALLEQLFLSKLNRHERERLDENMRLPDNWNEDDFITSDGARLRYVFSACANPKGLIVLLPGRAQTFHEYHEFVKEMNKEGYTVFALDRRSQGKSDGFFGTKRNDHHIPDFDRQILDVEEIMEAVVKKSAFKDLPRILVGHSMGGADGLMHLSKNEKDFNAAAFLAPMWGLQMYPELIKRKDTLAKVIDGLGMMQRKFLRLKPWSLNLEATEYGQNKVTSNLGRALQPTLFTRHPELITGVPTWGLAIQSVNICEKIKQEPVPEKVTIPVLTILAAGEDIVCNDAATNITDRMPNGEVLMVDGKHQSFNETLPIKLQTYRHFKEFCNSHLPPRQKPC